MVSLLGDIRYALRALARARGFTAAVVAVLALGIGANTAIFSVVKGVLLAPLPFEDPDGIVMVWEKTPRIIRLPVSGPNFLDWRAQNQVFEFIGAHSGNNFNLTGDGEAVRLLGAAITPGTFEVFGVSPALGRTFLPEEEEPGRNRVVVLSD